jgi:hypothetical protein
MDAALGYRVSPWLAVISAIIISVIINTGYRTTAPSVFTPRSFFILHHDCLTIFLINPDTLAADTCSDGYPILVSEYDNIMAKVETFLV